MEQIKATINKRCSCGRDIEGDYNFCSMCRSNKLIPSCKYYREIERRCTVPWCDLHKREIMGMAKLMKCRECDEKEG